MSAPLSPAEVDALLAPDARSTGADLLVLRDALSRMAGALEELADAVQRLHDAAAARDAGARAAAPCPPPRED